MWIVRQETLTPMTSTGVWLIGARGNVATTAIAGARALARGETDTTGLVTAREPYSRLALPDVEELVFGGHDIREKSLLETARDLSSSGVPSPETVDAVAEDLRRIDRRIETGTAMNCGAAVDDLADEGPLDDRLSVDEVVERIRDDYRAFRREHGLDRVVVVNVASTEPPLDDSGRYDTIDAFERAIAADDRDLPASALYAYAALVDEHPYLNFTPSTGSALGGLRELADDRDVPHTGRDAKTGETLVKSALAPMFAGRNLRVRSWEGHNILGNDDGRVLEDEANKAGKLASKGGVLDSILPGLEHNRVRIDYTPSLGDWKTAWDYVHFEGFLNTEMTMQFTWEGSDSALAAPLVLDLVRLLAHADERGEGGLQRHLASFFKAPLGVDEHDLSRQFALLDEYVDRHAREAAVE
ncbi:inositol-3-phosphate synthase [Halobellus limi]|uniref:Myo-inositol-1-phosphate synthase n=2 Tax=Halobellus limi TaxID=699433 RepID=A0A4D6H157_9EURY|nr:myo-inositol-1-phosphate synthase [Halobellus limi]